MAYELTFWSKTPPAQISKATATHATAATAWAHYQRLVASNEAVEIRDANGRLLKWQALEVLARRVMH